MKKTVTVVSRALSLALLLSVFSGVSADEINMVKAPRANEEVMKAPRDDAQGDAVVSCCSCSGEDNLECEILKEAKLIETKVDQLQTSLDECCEELNTKLDVDFAGTWTAIEEVQTTQDACCASLTGDFTETWTILGSPTETIADSILSATLDVNISTTFNIIEWLKLIYNKVK